MHWYMLPNGDKMHGSDIFFTYKHQVHRQRSYYGPLICVDGIVKCYEWSEVVI